MKEEKFPLILTYTLISLICLSPVYSQSNVHSQQQSADAYEPDNSSDQATPFQLTETQIHSIYPFDDLDFFHLLVNVSQYVIVTISSNVEVIFKGVGFGATVVPPSSSFDILIQSLKVALPQLLHLIPSHC